MCLLKIKIFFVYSLKKNFWPHGTTCGILVPPPGIELVLPAFETQSFNHWKSREVQIIFLKRNSYTWLKKSKGTKWYDKRLISFPPIPISSSHPHPSCAFMHTLEYFMHTQPSTYSFFNLNTNGNISYTVTQHALFTYP